MSLTAVPEGNCLIYDGDCPFCSHYVSWLRLQAAAEVSLVDARATPAALEMARAGGYDLNEGMLLYLDGAFYHGADCLHRLALLTTRSTGFNRMTRWLFRSPRIARISYPVLRAGRNLTLRLMGREAIG
jgi:predicted DCC family thiol-disulfide oxidoreductase YuxK